MLSIGAHVSEGAGLGKVGLWRTHFGGTDSVAEVEALGFGALWIGASPSLAQIRPFLEASTTLTVATAILNVWQHTPSDVARHRAELDRDFSGRFLLGLGIGHPESSGGYAKPLTTMREYLDGLDAADPPVPPAGRVMAALGPKMLDLAAQRTWGAHSYFVPAAHTRLARERMGPDALLAPEVTVLLERDPEAGREMAREHAARYFERRNYVSNLLRSGFTERDLENGGSDRLIDAVIPHGPAEAIAEAAQAHFDAGADHVALHVLARGGALADDYRALARVLLE